MTNQSSEFPYVWRLKTEYPERRGQRCRVLRWVRRVAGRFDSQAEIEFEDGDRMFVSRNGFRKAPTTAETGT